MKEIPLTQGKAALVDDEDFDRINAFKWYASKTKGSLYARRKTKRKGKETIHYMHRVIMCAGNSVEVDHRDRNGLNNQRHNLRVCDHQQNQRNRDTMKNNKSGLKGVSWHKIMNKWRAVIQYNGRQLVIGYFLTKEEAATAYDKKATELFGEFAKLNNVVQEELL